MRLIILFFISYLVISCGSKKNTTTVYNEDITVENESKYEVFDPVPEDIKTIYSNKFGIILSSSKSLWTLTLSLSRPISTQSFIKFD